MIAALNSLTQHARFFVIRLRHSTTKLSKYLGCQCEQSRIISSIAILLCSFVWLYLLLCSVTYYGTTSLIAQTKVIIDRDIDKNPLSSSSIIIVGMIRDSAASIGSMLHSLDTIACHFGQSSILIYESSSRDFTATYLQYWQSIPYSSVCATSVDEMHHKTVLRPQTDPIALARHRNEIKTREDKYVIYRNYLLNETIKEHDELRKRNVNGKNGNEYFAIFDDVTSLDHTSIIQELSQWVMSATAATATPTDEYDYNEYDVLCSNGQRDHMFWDSFAAILMNDTWLYHADKQGHRDSNNALIEKQKLLPVQSCFGGMVFYSNLSRIIETKCRYLSFEQSLQRYPTQRNYVYYVESKGLNELCEHISFHFCLNEHGFKIAIDRDMRLSYEKMGFLDKLIKK